MRIGLKREDKYPVNQARVVFLVLVSENEINKKDELIQRSTFGQLHRQSIYWLKGDSSIQSPSFNSQSRTLSVPVEEIQSNILEKTILGIDWLLQNEDFDLLVRTNVSSYFTAIPTSIVKKFSNKDKSILGGFLEMHLTKYAEQARDRSFISGSGIFMNRTACQELTYCDTKKYMGIPDDIAISHFLRCKGSEIVFVRRGNIHLTGIFFPYAYMRLKSSIDSDRTRQRMMRVHEYFSAKSISRRVTLWISFQLDEIRYFSKSVNRKEEVMKNFWPSRKVVLLNAFRRVTGYQGKIK